MRTTQRLSKESFLSVILTLCQVFSATIHGGPTKYFPASSSPTKTTLDMNYLLLSATSTKIDRSTNSCASHSCPVIFMPSFNGHYHHHHQGFSCYHWPLELSGEPAEAIIVLQSVPLDNVMTKMR